MARNFTYVYDQVKTRFPRTTAALETHLATNLFDNFVRDICSRYPYWFLEVPPGYEIPEDYPEDEADLLSRTPVFGDWLDRGWLHVKPDQSRYVLAAPADFGPDFETDPAYWDYVQAREIDFVKEYNFSGSQARDLEVVQGSRHYTVTHFATETQPRVAIWETGNIGGKRVSWIRLNPVPTEHRIYCIQFTLKRPIDYDPGIPTIGDFTNRLLEEYPEVMVTAGLLEAAKWFNEPDAIVEYRGELYGLPDDGRLSKAGKQREGLIARMKADTRSYKKQDVYSVPQYLGARGAVGREGVSRNRFRRPGIYFQNF